MFSNFPTCLSNFRLCLNFFCVTVKAMSCLSLHGFKEIFFILMQQDDKNIKNVIYSKRNNRNIQKQIQW